MDENVLAAAVWRDEAKALCGVEKFDRAGLRSHACVPDASGFTRAMRQGVVKSIAIVRKELEPIARTELFRHRRQAWPALHRCAAVTVASLTLLCAKGKTGAGFRLPAREPRH